MTRLTIALGVALTCFGCASDVVDEPTEDTGTTEPQRTPKRPLMAPYAVDPIQFAVTPLDEYRLGNDPPARRAPYEVWPYPPE